jgi:hypothetical protein
MGLSEVFDPPLIFDSTKLSQMCHYKAVFAEDSVNSSLLGIDLINEPGIKRVLNFYSGVRPKDYFEYLNYMQTGVQNFWNEDGFLIKKEYWKEGKLIKTVYYKTVIVKTEHPQ